jgi:GTPase Era involved in 16S rRNA processing
MYGNKPAELKGYNSLQLLPFMKELKNDKTNQEMFPGLLNNLSIKTVPSKERNFENIVFIDTPGLADGNLKYRFDVDEVYKWFAKHCDIVLVFLDPIGQALCSKTNTLINELITQECAEVRFIMTKGDMFKTEQDRAKCMCQITQGVSHAITAMHGFEMPLIYIPSESLNSVTQRLPEN